MDIHLLNPQGEQLVLQVVDGQVVIPPSPNRQLDQFSRLPNAAPASSSDDSQARPSEGRA